MSDIHGNGRPLKFKNVEELEKAIDGYFASLYQVAYDQFGNPIKDKFFTGEPDPANPLSGYVVKKARVATVTGLANYLGTWRDVLLDYESGKYDDRDEDGKPVDLSDEQQEWNKQVSTFSNTIKRAKQMILDDHEQQLFMAGRATGAIFSLKVNYGWQDKTVTELTNPDGTLNPYGALTTEELRALAKKGK